MVRVDERAKVIAIVERGSERLREVESEVVSIFFSLYVFSSQCKWVVHWPSGEELSASKIGKPLSEHKDILTAVARGDSNAFRQLYGLYADKVYNTALSYAQNEADAEEITQDVFTSIFRYAGNFKGESAVGTWIYRITVNTSLNHLKKTKRFSFLKFGNTGDDKPDFEHPGVLMENKENAKNLFKVIDILPENQKTAFILSYIEELPRQEVADIMELSLKAVESLLQRAKAALRKKLDAHYPGRRKKK